MKFNIRIEEPCGENWKEMTPSGKGRLCARCQKQVIDFTRMSEQEIVETLASTSQPCGRFRNSQLKKTYHSLPHWPRIPRVYKIGLAISLGAALTFSPALYAQQNDPPRQVQTDENGATVPTESMASVENRITGMVIDHETGESLPMVKIYVEGGQIGAFSDLDGQFSLAIPSGVPLPFVLHFEMFEYESEKIEIQDFGGPLLVELESDRLQISVGIIITDYSDTKQHFRRKKRKHSFDR